MKSEKQNAERLVFANPHTARQTEDVQSEAVLTITVAKGNVNANEISTAKIDAGRKWKSVVGEIANEITVSEIMAIEITAVAIVDTERVDLEVVLGIATAGGGETVRGRDHAIVNLTRKGGRPDQDLAQKSRQDDPEILAQSKIGHTSARDRYE